MSPDAWEFDAESLSLRSGARVERVTRRTADVLARLMRHRGHVVTREQLLRAWSGLNVTPDLVRAYVSDLRALLGDDPHAPRFIDTVRGRGYRLIGDIHAASADGSPPVRIAVTGSLYGRCVAVYGRGRVCKREDEGLDPAR